MSTVVLLCHRLPWPPSKGDKIRSYHVLRRLAARHRVYLGTFIDDPDDWRYVPAVEAVCAGACIRPLPRWRARARAFGSFTRGEPLTLGCYRDHVLQRWLARTAATERPDVILCYSSGVAPLALRYPDLPCVMDFVDADSDKWHQYAEARHGLARLLFRREARCLAAFERDVATQFDASLFVSPAEASFFRTRAPLAADKVFGVANGVDSAYWDPRRPSESPYPDGTRTVVFTGAMDYRANVDAVRWFADAVWPQIHAARADARFCIVGSNPTRDVLALGRRDGISVTGRVEDVRPYLAHAHVVAAPLRIARGIQNKVLEALAMEKPVLATAAAYEGIDDFAGRAGCISDAPAALAGEALRWLATPTPQSVPAARAYVRAHYDWERKLDAYEGVLRGAVRAARPADTAPAIVTGACP